MILSFDIYEQDSTSNGEPDYVRTIEREFENSVHALHFLVGFCNENNHWIIRNLRI